MLARKTLLAALTITLALPTLAMAQFGPPMNWPQQQRRYQQSMLSRQREQQRQAQDMQRAQQLDQIGRTTRRPLQPIEPRPQQQMDPRSPQQFEQDQFQQPFPPGQSSQGQFGRAPQMLPGQGQIAGGQDESQPTITGTIRRTRKVELPGGTQEHVIALVQTGPTQRVLVDLGPARLLNEEQIQPGREITLSGEVVELGGLSMFVRSPSPSAFGRGRGAMQLGYRPRLPQRGALDGQMFDGRLRSRAALRDRVLREAPEEAPAALGVLVDEAPRVEGVVVTGVYENSPAAEAGLRVGDYILQVDRRSIETPDELIAAVAAQEPYTPVDVTIWRDGERFTFDAFLTTRSEISQQLRGAADRPPREL